MGSSHRLEPIFVRGKSPSGSGRAKKWPWRYPPTVAGIQVNHCKNPCCRNFGVAPLHDRKRGRHPAGTAEPMPGDYIAVGVGKGVSGLKCLRAGKYFPCKAISLLPKSF